MEHTWLLLRMKDKVKVRTSAQHVQGQAQDILQEYNIGARCTSTVVGHVQVNSILHWICMSEASAILQNAICTMCIGSVPQASG